MVTEGNAVRGRGEGLPSIQALHGRVGGSAVGRYVGVESTGCTDYDKCGRGEGVGEVRSVHAALYTRAVTDAGSHCFCCDAGDACP